MRRIDPDDHATEWTDPSGAVVLTGQPLPPHLAGAAMVDLELDDSARIVAISRGGVAQLCSDDLVLQEGDLLYFVADADGLGALAERLQVPPGGSH